PNGHPIHNQQQLTEQPLRNFLVRRAGTPINRRTVVAAWQEILSINEDASVDEYLRHYWVSHHGDVKSRKLYREIKAVLTDQDVDAASYSRELAKEALVYRDIVAARSDNLALRRQLVSIRELGAKVLYPALLAGYNAADNDEASSGLLEMTAALVTLFVRYNVVSKRETTILEETVYSVASRLRISKDFDQAVNDLLELVPSLSEFREQFLELSLKRRATARYLLREIEVAKRHTQEISIEDSDRVHVEHIYPRNPIGRKWTDHSKYVDRLGNLTLLARRLNTSIRNADFAAKREAYGKSAILLASELADIEKWNVQAITARQKELSKFAERVWSVPRDSQGAVHESDGVVEGPGDSNQDTRGAGDEIDPEELPETPEA
ncbi:MAG: HNH endonuclease, partial [Acidimicrobiales bacterium]|nr:HNH endonuclease [Acidimicrobiales bacterium]MYI26957.1 HNH endonuclease [Acidimicrobiales bacterium]